MGLPHPSVISGSSRNGNVLNGARLPLRCLVTRDNGMLTSVKLCTEKSADDPHRQRHRWVT